MITAETFAQAEYLWCRKAQQDVFMPELTALKHGKVVLRTSSLLQLSPCLADDGLIRMKSRTGGDLIILPRNHVYTKLFVNQHHV